MRSREAYKAAAARLTAASTASATAQPLRWRRRGGGGVPPPPPPLPEPPPGPMWGSTGTPWGVAPCWVQTEGLVVVHCHPGSTCGGAEVARWRRLERAACPPLCRAIPLPDSMSRGKLTVQLLLQPSPSARSPSSHCSRPSNSPLPHTESQRTTSQRGSRTARRSWPLQQGVRGGGVGAGGGAGRGQTRALPCREESRRHGARRQGRRYGGGQGSWQDSWNCYVAARPACAADEGAPGTQSQLRRLRNQPAASTGWCWSRNNLQNLSTRALHPNHQRTLLGLHPGMLLTAALSPHVQVLARLDPAPPTPPTP